MTTTESWLVVRRLGSLWAVPVSAVRSVSAAASEVSIHVVGGWLCAEELIGLDSTLTVCPAGRVTRRFLPRGSWGLAMGDGPPAIVIDPIDPPSELRVREEQPG